MTTAHDIRQSSRADTSAVDGRRSLEVVCIASQPWDVDLPTNRQQVMARVAGSGHHVLYVETGGFLGRHVARLRDRRAVPQTLGRPRRISSHIRVVTAPALLPWGQRFRLAARLNALLTARLIRREARDDTATILWLYDPCYADAVGRCGEQFAVYDCVDDYAEQAGPDPRRRRLVARLDAEAASRCRLVFATTTTLVERHRSHNAKTHLVRNVGEFEHFAPAAKASFTADGLAPEPPVIGFAGNFTPQKVDFALLEAVAAHGWTLLLVGPAHPSTRSEVERLASRANVEWLGTVPYAELPRYVAAFDVGIIPYATNAYTRSCFPLKTFEYLAAGKPVVASGVPEVAGMEPHVVLTDEPRAFIAAIEDALERHSPEDVASRQALAAANTWETRTRDLLALVSAEL